MDITYDYYRIFYYVAKYGGISQAANALMRGQPNISKTVQTLEDQLGCKLLVRSNRGVTLTPEGEKLYRHLKVAFEHISAAENEILSERDLESGIISIATTEIALYGSVLSALTKFSTDHPHVKVKLTNSNNSNSLSMLKNGLADFAVLTMDKIDSGFRVKTIKNFREILCVKSGQLSSENFDIADILKNTYIGLNSSSYTYAFCTEYLMSLGINREPDIEVATANQVLQLVKAGIGIGFIAEPIADEWLKNGQIYEIKLPKAPPLREICLVEDKDRSLSVAAKTLVQYL